MAPRRDDHFRICVQDDNSFYTNTHFPHHNMETLTVMPHTFMLKPTQLPVPPMPMNTIVLPLTTMAARRPHVFEDKSPRSELLCRYPSKVCDNQRSEKRGGGLHRFCAEHRERANINQRRVDHRRRLRRRGALVSPTQRPHDHHSSDDEAHIEDEMISLELDTDAFDPNEPLLAALSDEDLKVLIAILDEPGTPMDITPIKSEHTK